MKKHRLNNSESKTNPSSEKQQHSTYNSREEEILSKLEVLNKLFNYVKKQTSLCFVNYKPATIIRRLVRRMDIVGLYGLEEYYDFLQSNNEELHLLVKDFLIGVTGFFRDAEAFSILHKKAIKRIVAKKKEGDLVKVWSVGCSTGQEAYSLAILIKEEMDLSNKQLNVKIFATDLSTDHIKIASKGIYPINATSGLSTKRFSNFFTQKNEHIEIKKEIRKMIIFSIHDITQDPAFHKIDLITCRNLLIYFQQDLQEIVLAKLHYALKRDGFIFLGNSEHLIALKDSFRSVSQKWRIYQNKTSSQNTIKIAQYHKLNYSSTTTDTDNLQNSKNTELTKLINDTLIDAFNVTSIIISDTFKIIKVNGSLKKLIQLPDDGFTMNIMELVSTNFKTVLRKAIHESVKNGELICDSVVCFEENEQRLIDLKVRFIPKLLKGKNAYLIILSSKKPNNSTNINEKRNTNIEEQKTENIYLQKLESELWNTRQQLKSSLEELEIANREKQVNDEEMIAANEELQSTNEELKSVNEELHLVNTELKEKVEEVMSLNTDLDNLLRSSDIGTIFLDRDLLIRRFTPAIKKHFFLRDSDIGRPINQFESLFENNDLLQRAEKVITTGNVFRREVYSKSGNWYLEQLFPFIDAENQIQGVVITFVDIGELKAYEQALKNRINTVNEQNLELERSKKAMLNIMEDLNEEKEKLVSSQQFLAKMSHEIRTPLNAIIGMAHLLYDTEPTPIQQEKLHILKTSSEILQGLVSSILDYSKIEAGEIEIKEKEFNLISLLKTLHRTFQLRLEESPIDVRLKTDDAIDTVMIGDDLLLNQVLINLMSNAAKFTIDGFITLEVKLIEKTDEQYQLAFIVWDTGIGIPLDNIDSIFDKFKQVDSEYQLKHLGTGLGLAITKQLIELQGGKIMVESRLNKGTKFTVYLSYKNTNKDLLQIARKTSNFPKLDLSENHVLVVEDNYMNRKYISTLLDKWNISYEIATDGNEAVLLTKKKKFSLIFMDVLMPNMGGYDATIAIRNSLGPNHQTPIVALTASAVHSEKEKAFSVGMNDFLPKPFNPVQLMEVIKSFSILDIEDNDKERHHLVFDFNTVLDTAFLKQCYAGDLDYALDMFKTFLNFTIKDIPKFHSILESEDATAISSLAHKLNPTFSMVGLTKLADKMKQLKSTVETDFDKEKILNLFKEIEELLSAYMPVLENEVVRMEKFLLKYPN